METQLAIVENPIMLAIPKMINQVDFTGLNTAITNLANYNKDLTLEEKQAGIDLVGEWNTNVVEALKAKAEYMRTMVGFFNNQGWNDISIAEKERIAEASGTEDEYAAFIKAAEDLDDFLETEPVRDIIDPLTMTKGDIADIDSAYELALTKFQITKKRLESIKFRKDKEWRQAVRTTKDFKAMQHLATQFRNDLDSLISDCGRKAQLAKMNIMISSPETRENLKEILNFINLI